MANSDLQPNAVSKRARWIGYTLSMLVILFLLMDGVMKLFNPPPVVESMTQLGYPSHLSLGIGALLLVCTVIYLIPATATLGAILLTGYLGGAIATHVRAGSPIFSILFPVILGLLMWGGLYLRDKRLRMLVPLHRQVDNEVGQSRVERNVVERATTA